MALDTESDRRRVVVVTGGAAGIGKAIAEELGRSGAYVVTLDPGVKVDGAPQDGPPAEETTAERIVASGGRARASNASVTDAAAVKELFSSLVDEFGALDAVVNVAGISRPSDFAAGVERDWADILSVHLNGYLNVLRSALPLMTAAGSGRILGVTSGSGWRPANTGAYGCAKRAVAALTWQIGAVTPRGVTVNALSPIAATRMVTGALSQSGPPQAGEASEASRTGGLSLSSMPPPENLGPVGAYLASDRFGWASGRIIFSSGAECAVIPKPGLLEVARTRDVTSLAHALAAVVPASFVPAEMAQATQGASNPRVGPVFDETGEPAACESNTCLLVSDDADWSAALTATLAARGVRCVQVGAGDGPDVYSREIASGFEAISAQVGAVTRDRGPVDAVVVALRRNAGSAAAAGEGWRSVLTEHDGVVDDISTDAAWSRAVADLSAATDRPVRAIMLIDASTSGGWTRGQAATQLSRAAHTATSDRVDACTISVESNASIDVQSAAELAGHLVCGPDTAALSGAELMVASGWLGLRSHPNPGGSISFGGPSTPDWLDVVLRQIIAG